MTHHKSRRYPHGTPSGGREALTADELGQTFVKELKDLQDVNLDIAAANLALYANPGVPREVKDAVRLVSLAIPMLSRAFTTFQTMVLVNIQEGLEEADRQDAADAAKPRVGEKADDL